MRRIAAAGLAVSAIVASSIGLVTSFVAYKHANMPFNSEGNYFDGIVSYHDGSQYVYGAIALLAFFLAGCMTWAARFLLSKRRETGHH